VLLGLESERVDVDTSIRGTGVVLPRLDLVEVGTLTLREAVLTVKLELGSDNWVLTPAVHVEGSLRENESASIGNGGLWAILALPGKRRAVLDSALAKVGQAETICSCILEESRGVDDTVRTFGRTITAERLYGVRKSIDSIGVVERLGTKSLEEDIARSEGRAVVYVRVRLHNPDKLLARVVEVKANLVRRGTNRLSTSVLELLDEVLMWVLCHTTALVGVKVDVVNIQRRGHKRLAVGSGRLCVTRGKSGISYSPEALINRTKLNVNLYLVVLESNKRKSKTRVVAEPELKRDVESGLR
jgi:hypothetical protein